MTKNEHPPARSIAEHDIVRTREPLSDGGVTVPKGTLGTIVFVHERDSAFEVEFAPPFEAVVSVRRRQIETV